VASLTSRAVDSGLLPAGDGKPPRSVSPRSERASPGDEAAHLLTQPNLMEASNALGRCQSFATARAPPSGLAIGVASRSVCPGISRPDRSPASEHHGLHGLEKRSYVELPVSLTRPLAGVNPQPVAADAPPSPVTHTGVAYTPSSNECSSPGAWAPTSCCTRAYDRPRTGAIFRRL
jgi:hypothetical protein